MPRVRGDRCGPKAGRPVSGAWSVKADWQHTTPAGRKPSFGKRPIADMGASPDAAKLLPRQPQSSGRP